MKNILLFLLASLLLFLIVGCSDDTTGNAEKASPSSNEQKETKAAETEEDHRIVSTTVAATEIFDALEINLVGVPTSYKTLPQRYDGIPEVGNPMSPDMELVKSLDPTEVYSVTTLKTDLESVFENVDINGEFLDFQSVDSVLTEVTKLGEKYNRNEQAEQVVSEIETNFAEIEASIAEEDSPSVLILMGVPGSYLVATEHSYIGDLVERAGGQNVVENEDVEYLASNTEYLQQANPDVILRAAHGMPEEVVEMFDEEFKTNDIWKHFKAVEQDRVYDLPELLFGTTGNLKITEAMNSLVEMLYPEL